MKLKIDNLIYLADLESVTVIVGRNFCFGDASSLGVIMFNWSTIQYKKWFYRWPGDWCILFNWESRINQAIYKHFTSMSDDKYRINSFYLSIHHAKYAAEKANKLQICFISPCNIIRETDSSTKLFDIIKLFTSIIKMYYFEIFKG